MGNADVRLQPRKPDGEAVSGHAKSVISKAKKFHALRGDVVSTHRRARALVHGDPAQAMGQATDTATTMADTVLRRGVVVAGAIHEFAHGITAFNEQVATWNAQIQAADDPEEKYKALLPRYEDAETLRAAERTAISRIHHWDDDSTVVSLWQAGALPTSVKPLFPGLGLKFAGLDQLPPDIAHLSPTDRHGLSLDELGALLDRARDLGLDPQDYAGLLQTYYVTKAADKAGIDLQEWDPKKGADALQDTIENVYTYYGQLFLNNPELQWAGMANMIGPSFAGGFMDLDQFGSIADAIGGAIDELPLGAGGILPGPFSEIRKLSSMSSDELEFYETTLLNMQQKIFFDMGASHEAYLDGGMDAIQEMANAGLFDDGSARQTVKAWEQIDEGRRTGNMSLIAEGNEKLLFREQHDIIDDDYEEMESHLPTGPAMTYLMGAIGSPSVPGAHSLAEVNPFEATGEISPTGPFLPGPGIDVTVQTPLPDGNIADFDTRWDMVKNDTLPAYQELLENDPDRARDIIGSDVHQRIEEQRLANRMDEILDDFRTNWGVYADGHWW